MQGASISTQPPPQPLISPGTPKHCSEGLRALRAEPTGVDGSTISAFWFWLRFFFSTELATENRHGIWCRFRLAWACAIPPGLQDNSCRSGDEGECPNSFVGPRPSCGGALAGHGLGQGQWILMVRVLLEHVLTPVITCLVLQASTRNFGVGGRGGPALLGNLLDPRTYVE